MLRAANIHEKTSTVIFMIEEGTMFRGFGAILILTVSMLGAGAAPAADSGGNVLLDMFAWWNEAIQTEGAFTEEAFGRYFTEDAQIVVNGTVSARGLRSMVEQFRRIQQETEYVEIVLPFEEGFRDGNRIFTHHLIRARENGADRLTHVMGYAVVEDGKLALVNLLHYSEPTGEQAR